VKCNTMSDYYELAYRVVGGNLPGSTEDRYVEATTDEVAGALRDTWIAGMVQAAELAESYGRSPGMPVCETPAHYAAREIGKAIRAKVQEQILLWAKEAADEARK
jgi:hypothetical protein